MQVYLKKPYRINNAGQKSKKETNQPKNLFRAENDLMLHTVLRSTFENASKPKTLEDRETIQKFTLTEFFEEANVLIA